jgi:hypothetical protein
MKLWSASFEKELVAQVTSGLIVVAIASATFFFWHHYVTKDGKA